MLEEVGVPYEYHKVDLRSEEARIELRKLNPLGKIPYLVDGDVKLCESAAINFYLAEKYKPEMMPADLADRARVYMWSFWAMTNLQPDALAVMHAKMRPDEEHPGLPAKQQHVQRLLDHLERELGDYLVANTFSVADVIAGSVVNFVDRAGAGTLGPRTTAWLEGLRSRASWNKVAAQG
jgi:glutathione S-transferase